MEEMEEEKEEEEEEKEDVSKKYFDINCHIFGVGVG